LFYAPTISEAHRQVINTALLSGHGAEALFSESVLFVEGDGDRQFFEALRRRLAPINDLAPVVDRMYVVPVGSKTSFAPWIRLVRSYGQGKRFPISWFVVADGDAANDLLRAFHDSSIKFSNEIRNLANTIGAKQNQEPFSLEEWLDACRNFNAELRQKTEIPCALMPCDLEYQLLENASVDYIARVAKEVGLGVKNHTELLKKLGSKIAGNSPKNSKKDPWIRGHIGRTIAFSELSTTILDILESWVGGVEGFDGNFRNMVQEP